MPLSLPGAVTAMLFPLEQIIVCPFLGRCVPIIAFSSVDLPHPEGPTKATISPLIILKLISCKTFLFPNEWLMLLHSRTMSFMLLILAIFVMANHPLSLMYHGQHTL